MDFGPEQIPFSASEPSILTVTVYASSPTPSPTPFQPYTTLIPITVTRPPNATTPLSSSTTWAPYPTIMHAVAHDDIPTSWRPKQLEMADRQWYLALSLMGGLFSFGILLVWAISLCRCWWNGDCFWNCESGEYWGLFEGRKMKKKGVGAYGELERNW